MQQGDLVHIPQNVMLFDRQNSYLGTTDKPVVAVLIEEISDRASFQAGSYIVFAQGREVSVEKRYIYLMERAC